MICGQQPATVPNGWGAVGLPLSYVTVHRAFRRNMHLGKESRGETTQPGQCATTFGLVVNLKTAKALGLAVPPGMLDLANEVIE
jgi:hypothetical protein